MAYKPASRKGTSTLIGLTGESGSGKTRTALRIARGLVGEHGRIAGIDTETGRMSHHSDVTPFDVQELNPPFTPERYIELINEAASAGYDALVIDSGTHEWEGEGGILEFADSQKTKNGSELTGMAKWAKPKARHKKFKNAILLSRMHVILCLRGKYPLMEVVNQQTNKKELVRGAMKPIQDESLLFEMTVSLILEPGQPPIIRKCPGELVLAFQNRQIMDNGIYLTEKHGEAILAWVNDAPPAPINVEALLRAAEAEADDGEGAYRVHYTKALNQEQRDALAPHHEALKARAKAADAKRLNSATDNSFPGDR